MSGLKHPKRPCAECPWRTDVETGRFPPERFVALANTAYDMSVTLFQCHKSTDDEPLVCAGFLLVGADHNLSVRMAGSSGHLSRGVISDGGYPLFQSYTAMAVANGVNPRDRALRACRLGARP